MSKIIRGSKGPSQPREPVRAEDTLNSKEFATIQDLLSEGEIEGFATPSKKSIARNNANYNNACLADIFLNDTAVLNVSPDDPEFTTKLSSLTDSDFSFEDITFIPKFGEGNQKPVANLENANLQKTSNTILTNSAVVTTSSFVDSPDISTNPIQHAVEVTIQFLGLQKFETNGDILGTEVRYQIQLQTNGGNFTTVVDETITGRSKDSYSREHTINLPNDTFGNANYTQAKIRVKRITADSNQDEIQDTFGVSRIEEVVYTPQSYPDCAYSTLRLSAEQFSSVPRRAFRIRGIKVKIPGAGANNSGTPTVDINTGRIQYPTGYIFNGTMGAAVWCTCPSMILLDVLTNQRYGLGVHISPDQSTDAKRYESIDLFSYVQASRYANEEVTLDDGTKEARFACNASIQGTAEAYQLINELAGVMRAFPIWQTGSITLTQDRPTDSSYLFSLANVTEAGFSYSGSSLKQRHSVISVRYFNMDSREIDYEVFEDTAAIAKLGIIKKTVQAFGCTSRTQAIRLAKAILFSEQNESETVSFTTSIDAGAIVRPGSVISINDPVRSVQRRSGRVKSATTEEITVDSDKDLSTFVGGNQTLSIMLPDGKVETKNVTAVNNNVISLSSALSQTPSANSIWMLSSTGIGGVEPQTFRVITVEEQDGVNYAITALTYIPGKYANIEEGVPLPVRNLSLLNQPKDPPSGLIAEERIIVKNKLAIVKIILSWVAVTGVSQYQVQYRFNNTNWVIQDVFRPDFEVEGTEAGTYEFRVFSYNAALKISETSTDLTFNAVGKNAPPGDVQNLQMEPVDSKNVRLKWDQSVDPDVLHGGRVYVRHSSLTDGTGTFNNAIDLVNALSGNSTEQIVPALEGEYILRFQDDQGNFSTGSASVLVDLPDILDQQIITVGTTTRQDLLSPAYGGQKIDTSVVNNALRIEQTTGTTTGFYDFKDLIDLEQVYALDIKRFIRSVGFQVQQNLKNTTGGGIKANNTNSTQSIQGVQVPAKTIRVTSNVVHNLVVGDPVQLVGQGNFNPVNGTYTVSTVGSTTQFDLSITAANNLGFNTFTTSGQYKKLTLLDQLIPAGSFWDDYATDGNFDGVSADSVNCKMFVASTNVDPASTLIGFTNGTSFTYVQDDGSEDGTTSGTVMTCSLTNHGLKVGDNIKIIFIQDNFNTFYTVQTVPNANKFTITSFVNNQAVSSGSGNFLKFTKFADLTNGTFKGRAFAFQLKLTTGKPLVENIDVQQAGITALFPARTENSYLTGNSNNPVSMAAQQSSASGQMTVTFANRFFTGTSTLGGVNAFKPNIGVTVQDLNSGEYVRILNVTGTSFDIVIRNSSNNAVARTFTFTAVGYGKGV
jgi:predicted phage tail protein